MLTWQLVSYPDPPLRVWVWDYMTTWCKSIRVLCTQLLQLQPQCDSVDDKHFLWFSNSQRMQVYRKAAQALISPVSGTHFPRVASSSSFHALWHSQRLATLARNEYCHLHCNIKERREEWRVWGRGGGFEEGMEGLREGWRVWGRDGGFEGGMEGLRERWRWLCTLPLMLQTLPPSVLWCFKTIGTTRY